MSGLAGCMPKWGGGGGRGVVLRQGVIAVESHESAPEPVLLAESFDAHVLIPI